MLPPFSFDIEQFLGLIISSTVLLGAIALVMLVCRQPLHRLYVARAGLLGFLLLPFLDQLDLVPEIRVRESLGAAWLFSLEWLGPKAEAIGAYFSIPMDHRDFERLSGFVNRSSLIDWASTFYLFGVSLGAIRLLLGLAGGFFLVSTSRIPTPEIQKLYGRLPFRPRHRPRLRISPRLGRPMLIGAIRPKIVLPESLVQRDPLKLLESILVHELVHAEAKDPAFTLLTEMIQVVAFPIVPLWWIRSQIRLDQEFLADARTVERLGNRVGYASSLISLSAKSSDAPIPFSPIRNSLSRDGSNLYCRILMLLRSPFELKTATSLGWMVVCFGIVLSLTILATLPCDHPSTQVRSLASKTLSIPGKQSIPTLLLSPNLIDPARLIIPCPEIKNFVLEGHLFIDQASLDRVQIAGLHLGLPDQAARFISPWSYFPHWQTFRIEVGDLETRLEVGSERWDLTRQSFPIGTLTFLSTSKLPISFSGVTLTWDASVADVAENRIEAKPVLGIISAIGRG